MPKSISCIRPHHGTPRTISALSAAICVGSIAVLLASSAEAQITFTVPADAPDGGLGTVGILEVTANGGQGNQDNARTSLQSLTGTRITGTASVLDFWNSDGAAQAHFPTNLPFLSDPSPSPQNGTDDVNDIAILYRGTLNIPTAGDYTFLINTDDGFTVAFDNGTSPFTSISGHGLPTDFTIQTYNGNANGAIQFFPGRGGNDSFGVINLSAGNHPFVVTYHEGGGGSGIEVSAASGAQTTFNSGFRPFGAPAETVTKKLVTVGTWDYVRINGSTSLDDAVARYANNNPTGDFVRAPAATVNFIDPENPNAGGHTPTQPFPGDGAINEENFGGAGRVTLQLSAADVGHYTFLVYGDDSVRFRIQGPAGSLIPLLSFGGGAGNGSNDTGTTLSNNTLDGINDAFRTTGCCSDAYGTFDLNIAGTYTLEAVFNEQGGGAGFFVYGGAGDLAGFDPSRYQLVGENINTTVNLPAGLQLVPEPGSIAMSVLGGLGLLGLRRRRK